MTEQSAPSSPEARRYVYARPPAAQDPLDAVTDLQFLGLPVRVDDLQRNDDTFEMRVPDEDYSELVRRVTERGWTVAGGIDGPQWEAEQAAHGPG